MRHVIGESTISVCSAVNLRARALRITGCKRGDRLFVEVLDDEVVILSRRPEQIADAFAGKLTHLFPDPDDTRRFLAEERASWGDVTR